MSLSSNKDIIFHLAQHQRQTPSTLTILHGDHVQWIPPICIVMPFLCLVYHCEEQQQTLFLLYSGKKSPSKCTCIMKTHGKMRKWYVRAHVFLFCFFFLLLRSEWFKMFYLNQILDLRVDLNWKILFTAMCIFQCGLRCFQFSFKWLNLYLTNSYILNDEKGNEPTNTCQCLIVFNNTTDRKPVLLET